VRSAWASPRDDLDGTARLIEECGYGELADAAAAYKRLYGAAGWGKFSRRLRL
jgi:hypothetical protein